jgi:diadenosine tetraphosphate (Ap4A) HIT family hydrolase
MSLIYQTENFIVESVEPPLVSRTDGGHLAIVPKVKVKDRTELSPKLATEIMRLTMLVGEAMTIGLNRRGIDIGRINYQDNGNWAVFKPEGPAMHIHLYGRAKSAKVHKYGEACYFPFRETGFYDGFEPLTPDDIAGIQAELEKLLQQEKYKLSNWKGL